MKLGIVTYQLAADWDIDKIIEKSIQLGINGVELRTSHKHRVEPCLSKKERQEVKNKFKDAPVEIVGLGSCCEYHSPDPEVLKENIEATKQFVLLANDTGAGGVKVRPNALPEGVPEEKTIEQIGSALRKVSLFAADYGIKIRLEVHGKGTSRPAVIKQIFDIADTKNLYVCWNSNPTDMDSAGSIENNFNLLKNSIELCHIHELSSDYPWISLFGLLQSAGYKGFCLAEIPASPEPERLMQYYKTLFETFQLISQKREANNENCL